MERMQLTVNTVALLTLVASATWPTAIVSSLPAGVVVESPALLVCSKCSAHKEDLEACVVNSTYVGRSVSLLDCPDEYEQCYSLTVLDRNGAILFVSRGCSLSLSSGSVCTHGLGLDFSSCYCNCRHPHCPVITASWDGTSQECLDGTLEPVPTVSPGPDSADDVTSEPEPDSADNVTSEPAPDSADNVTSEPAPDSVDNVTSEPEPDSADNVTSEPEPDSADNVTSEPEPDSADNVTSEPEPDSADNVTSEPEPDSADNVTSEPEPDSVDNVTSEPEPDSADNVTSEPEPDSADNVTSEPAPDSADYVTSEPAPEPSDELVCAQCIAGREEGIEQCVINGTYVGRRVTMIMCPNDCSVCFTHTDLDENGTIIRLFRGCGNVPSNGSNCSHESVLNYDSCCCYCDQEVCNAITNPLNSTSQGCLPAVSETPTVTPEPVPEPLTVIP